MGAIAHSGREPASHNTAAAYAHALSILDVSTVRTASVQLPVSSLPCLCTAASSLLRRPLRRDSLSEKINSTPPTFFAGRPREGAEEGGEHIRRTAVLLFLCFMAEGFLRLCRLRALIHPRTRAPTQRLIHTEAGVHHVVLPASQRVAMPRDRDRTEPAALRAKIRTNDFTGQTSGHAAGFVQANFCALPKVRRGILLVVLRAGRCRQPVCPREKT